jgi:hypothetical protein
MQTQQVDIRVHRENVGCDRQCFHPQAGKKLRGSHKKMRLMKRYGSGASTIKGSM